MNTFDRNLSRRSFLSLFALATVSPRRCSAEHHFPYDGVIGTSLDLVIWTPSAAAARRANRSVLHEIDRLASILDTRNPASEISVSGSGLGGGTSRELADVLAAYDFWERRTDGVFSIRPDGPQSPLNVDALGKAYIIERAVTAARSTIPTVDAVLLNIGGDIVIWGRPCDVAIADPRAWYDNAAPIARVALTNAAVATSGSYARGAHLWDPRHGQPLTTGAAATVVAPDAVTANALATTLCLMDADDCLRLVESTPGAEALRIAANGEMERTSGFAKLERPLAAGMARPEPSGFQLTVTLTLTHGRSRKRPYVAVWVEDAAGQLVRLLAVWGNQLEYQYELLGLWGHVGHDPTNLLHAVTRATRGPGKYELMWDGLNDHGQPVPPGTYRIVVETNQEHGTYAKQAGTIEVGDRATSVTLPATANFEPVLIQYRPQQSGS